MPTPLFAPLTALHRPGQSLQHVQRLITPLSSPAGVFSVRAHADAPRTTHDLDLLFESPAHVDLFWTWFAQQRGAQVPFWLPSYQQDLVPVATLNADDAVFLIRECGYSDLLFPLPERQAIAFVKADGTLLKRDIVAAINNGDGTETITINEELGEAFVQTRASGICLLWYGRLADDVARMEWDTGGTGSMKLKMVELLDPPLGGSGSGGPIDGSFPDPGE